MASKALNQMLRDAAWGNLDFLLIDLLRNRRYSPFDYSRSSCNRRCNCFYTATCGFSRREKGIAMFTMESINIPVLGLIENMAYFTPEELPENKYYIFWKTRRSVYGGRFRNSSFRRNSFNSKLEKREMLVDQVALQEGSKIAEIYKETAQK